MGQYFTPVILKEDKKTPIGFAYSHDFGSGLKLMEHSWAKNDFVGFIESLLKRGMAFHKTPIVWAGDYADEEPFESIPKEVIDMLVAQGYTLEELQKNGANIQSIAECSAPKLRPNTHKIEDFKILKANETRYLVNHDKKEFVDKTKTPKDNDGWQIHPLPLLTCEGNGRGGGDFHKGGDVVGRWARDIISVERTKSAIPKDYTELKFDLVE
jgi:hypothetical protein